MKKPTIALKERQIRLAAYRARERFLRAGRRRVPQANRYVAPGELIKAPTRVDVTKGSGREVVKFLRALATTVLVNKMPVRLDFRLTETFYPAGTIMLYAEIDRIATMSELPKPVTIIDPRARRPREVLKQIGLHEITGDKCDVVPEREDVVYWKATKGVDQSGEKLAMLEVVAERVNAAHAQQLELSGAWRGVSEAVANSVEHAYKLPRADGFTGLPDTRWWMFTQLRQGTFTMAVCDLGCGYRATIAQTVPEQFLAEVVARFAGGNRDAIAIRAAMEYGRTGTKKTERGKGSRDALSVVQKHGAGELIIFSNTGWMRYVFRGGEQVDEFQGDLGIDIRGTIVWWKLPLKGD
ncbi:hypothetical protein [Variovorax saccharolyticus]|uniref:hypothetical protein n=1 Tax=Variovorax saccharolyticus TaxID=3053516 RepID=UPI002578BEAF|nr:hypothetical protein [Variovorax sp. J22R187]MDM0018363.1 hypothetical protein [Variovorax sp. J22R187]